jgi:spore cortex biosynthesis protein YabQ
MILSLTMQVKLVVFSILAGALTGILFDFYRTFRGFENIPKIFIILEDILFWIFASILVFIFLLYTNYAVMGVYVYLYMAFGIYIYMKLISNFFTRIQYKFIKLSSKVIRIIMNFTFYPLKLLLYSLNSKNKQNFKRNDLNKT